MSVISAAVFADLKAMSGDDLMGELIEALFEDAPKMLEAMRTALAAHDVDSFRRNVHSMKSNAETFGATELAEIARTLEATARAGSLEIGDGYARLCAAYRMAADELRRLRP